MNGPFERWFGVHTDLEPTPDELNDVEVLNSADYDGAPYVPYQMGTADDPLVVYMPGAIKVIPATPITFTTNAYCLPALGDIVQLGNYNPFRRRYNFRPWTNNVWLCNSRENAAATAAAAIAAGGQNIAAPAFLPTNNTDIYSTGELWAVCTLAGVSNNFHVLQEFYDGGAES